MTLMQTEDGYVHLAYYRADKGLSFTWNGTKGNVADISYGGYAEPPFATLGLGDFEHEAPSLGIAFAQFQAICDKAADNFDISFWQRAIDRAASDGPAQELPECCAVGGYAKDGDGVVRCATCWDDFYAIRRARPAQPSWGERGPQTAAEYDAEAPALPDIPLALAGYHGADEVTCQRAPYDVLWCAQHRDDFPDGAAKCLSAAGLPQRGYRSGVTAAGFTDSFEWPNEEGRWDEGERHSEARIGASLLRHAAAHGHAVRDLDFLMAVYRDARRRFPRGGGEENTDIGRLGASISYWMA